MRYLVSALIVFACLMGGAGAGGKAPAIGVRGTIKNVTKGKDKILATILVEGSRDKDTSVDKAVVKITKTTRIVRVALSKDEPAPTVADLKTGTRVEVIFVGPVAESYPVQATAGEIRILPPKAP